MDRRNKRPGRLGPCMWAGAGACALHSESHRAEREAGPQREADPQREAGPQRGTSLWAPCLHPRSRKRAEPMWTVESRLALQGTA